MVIEAKLSSSKMYNATPTPATIGSIGQAIRSPEIEFLYFVAYGWIQPFILLLGIVGNTLNLCVLLNPNRKHVTHILMRGMALSDSIVVYTLIPIIYYRHITYLNRFNQSIDIYNVHVSETQYALKSFESLFQDTGLSKSAPFIPTLIQKPKNLNETSVIINKARTPDGLLKIKRVKRYSPVEYIINRSVIALQPDPRNAVDNWWDWWLRTNLLYDVSNLTSIKFRSKRGIDILKLIKVNNTYYERSFIITYPSGEEGKHLIGNTSFLVINPNFLRQKQDTHKLLAISESKGKITKPGRLNRKKSKILLQGKQHQLDTKWWAYYRLFGLYLIVNTFFAASTFVTVSMAIERFVTVYYPFKCSRICSKSRTRLMVALSFIVAIVISLPLAWDYKIVSRSEVVLTKVYGVFSKVLIEYSNKGINDLIWINPRTFINDYLENKTSNIVTFLNKSATNVSTHELILVKNITLHLNPHVLSKVFSSLPLQSNNVTRGDRLKISIYQYISTKTITNKVHRYYREHNFELDKRFSYKVIYKWIWAVALRMAPIVLLVILNILIVVSLKEAAKRRASLMSHSESSSYNACTHASKYLNKHNGSKIQGNSLKNYDLGNKSFTKVTFDDIFDTVEGRHGDEKLLTPESKNDKSHIYNSLQNLHSVQLSMPNVYKKELIHSRHKPRALKFTKKPINSDLVKNGVWFSVPETTGLLIETIPKLEQGLANSNVDNENIQVTQSYRMKYFYNALMKRLRITKIDLTTQYPRKSSSTSTLSLSTIRNNNSLHNRVQSIKYIRKEQNLTKLLIAISCLFTVCVTPQVFVMTQGYEGDRKTSYLYHLFTVTSNLLELMNYCLNFYLYCLCSADFRRHLKQFLRNINKKCRLFFNRLFIKHS